MCIKTLTLFSDACEDYKAELGKCLKIRIPMIINKIHNNESEKQGKWAAWANLAWNMYESGFFG